MIEISINDWRNNVLWCENLSITQKAVGCAICSFYRPDKRCYPSYTTLCEMLNISRATLAAALKALVSQKFIKIKKGEIAHLSSMTNFYEFVGVNSSANSSVDSSIDSSADSSPNSSADSSITELEYREKEKIYNNNNLKKEKTYKKEKKFSQEFQVWWHECPRKVSKIAAEKAFNTLLAEKKVTFEELLAGIKRYAQHCKDQHTEEQYIKHPSTWLNQGCWGDEYIQTQAKTNEPDFSWL